jgi:hypothetical protein
VDRRQSDLKSADFSDTASHTHPEEEDDPREAGFRLAGFVWAMRIILALGIALQLQQS